ncbi:hypothetical protein E8E14_003253 [Neopestalotiopsis sp. 37M]|nr:hypothetical protein E8E14_003253 [Neopestalotiopsis sp. 37M]
MCPREGLLGYTGGSLDRHGYPERLKNGGLGKIKAKHIQEILSMVHDENMARRADYLEEAETGIQADVAGAVNITDDPTVGLSAGSDPISEGRRICIGNLKYTVTRSQVKHLLCEFGVYNTVEKIYMPYAEGTQEVPLDQHDYLADRGYDGECYNGQEEPIELPNKGYVFVTYGDPAEAEVAINRLGGIYHLERKLYAGRERVDAAGRVWMETWSKNVRPAVADFASPQETARSFTMEAQLLKMTYSSETVNFVLHLVTVNIRFDQW